MLIQWFPGHMAKALRILETELKLADCVFYTLDARAPFSCINPKLNEICKGKPFIYILNKADLSDENTNKRWQKHFSKDGNIAIVLNSTKSSTSQILIKETLTLLSSKLEKYKQKGISKPLRAIVIGVPNSGKSTLINNLCNKGKATTGNKPGVTKGKQWVRINTNLEVLDMPGTLWPSFDNQTVALNLAFIGSIKDDVVDTFELCMELIRKLKKIAPNSINERYNITELSQKDDEVIMQIAQKRGFLLAKGELDIDRTCVAILDDFRKGKFGKISLEQPNDR